RFALLSKRRAFAFVLALAFLAAVPARGVAAGDPPIPAGEEAMKKEVDRLLSEVASDKFETREAARKRLLSIARAARSALEARREDPDPEIRRTVRTLLEALGQP